MKQSNKKKSGKGVFSDIYHYAGKLLGSENYRGEMHAP
jgi:hypothetical protein